jgi:FMN phosphatase YigB (HAD superfamily)
LAANEILFIDDLPENIAAAQEVGMQGIVFETKQPAKMVQDLRQLLFH